MLTRDTTLNANVRNVQNRHVHRESGFVVARGWGGGQASNPQEGRLGDPRHHATIKTYTSLKFKFYFI